MYFLIDNETINMIKDIKVLKLQYSELITPFPRKKCIAIVTKLKRIPCIFLFKLNNYNAYYDVHICTFFNSTRDNLIISQKSTIQKS